MNEPASNIGERLRRTRTALDISLDETSRRTGVSKPMLGQIERGSQFRRSQRYEKSRPG